MSNTTVAKRYALALFQLGKEAQLLDQLEEELRVVKDVFVNNPGVSSLLSSPKLSLDQKKAMLKEAFASSNQYILNTLMVMVDRHRSQYIVAMAEDFIELANEERGIAEAKVFSVRPLTNEEREALSASFAKKVGKKSLRIDNVVDSNMLGGLKLRIGNRIFDGSLRGKLELLERNLLG